MIFEGTKKSIFFGLGLTRAGVRKPPEYVMYMINIILIKEETNGVYRTKRIKRKYEE